MLCAELEKNLRRYVGRFSHVRLLEVHAASDRLPVLVLQASSDSALQLILHFDLPSTPVNSCLQESPKVLNWASLRDNWASFWGFDSGAARTGSQAHFPQPGSLPLLLSWSSIRGLLALVVLHTSFLQDMMHIRLADVELPGQRVPWRTNMVTCLFHQPVLACFGVVSVVSGHFHFSFQVSHHSQTFPKSKTPFSWKLPNSQNVSQQKDFPKLVVDLPKLSNGFPPLNFIHALHPACTMCFFGKQNCSG